MLLAFTVRYVLWVTAFLRCVMPARACRQSIILYCRETLFQNITTVCNQDNPDITIQRQNELTLFSMLWHCIALSQKVKSRASRKRNEPFGMQGDPVPEQLASLCSDRKSSRDQSILCRCYGLSHSHHFKVNITAAGTGMCNLWTKTVLGTNYFDYTFDSLSQDCVIT